MTNYDFVPQSPITGVRGWLTDKEEQELIRLAQLYTPDTHAVILELGGEYGRSASAFAYALKHSPNSEVHTIDLFPANHGVVGDLLPIWKENTEPLREWVKIIPHQCESSRYPRGMSKIELDVLFIDACHWYDCVIADLDKWASHVKVGGVMILHDYAKAPDAHVQHIEVKQACDDWLKRKPMGVWEFHDIAETSLVFIVRLENE